MRNKRVVLLVVLLLIAIFINLAVFLSRPGTNRPSSPTASTDEEPILSFASEIRITEGDDIFVTEEIKVRSLGVNLKRGITRQIPNNIILSNGQSQPVTQALMNVMRNGESIAVAEPKVEDRFTTYYLGEADKYLAPADYQFLFQYTLSNAIEIGEGRKHLRFNVTGAAAFPTYAASATIRLPQPFSQESISFSGAIKSGNSTASDADQSNDVSSSFAFDDGSIDPSSRGNPLIKIWTDRKLKPFEQLVVEVSWPE